MKSKTGNIPNETPIKAPAPATENISAIFWLSMLGLNIFQAVRIKPKIKPVIRKPKLSGKRNSKAIEDEKKIARASRILIKNLKNLIASINIEVPIKI